MKPLKSPLAQVSPVALVLWSLLYLSLQPASGQIAFSEMLASNRTVASDEAEQFDDWIELRNLTSEDIALGGMFLSDEPAGNLKRWQIPEGLMLRKQSYLLVWTDGHPEQGDLHASFSLSRGGGSVVLVDRDGASVIDRLDYGQQGIDISLGRPLAGGEDLVFYPTPTPGQPNITTPVAILATVEASATGGLFRGVKTVALTNPLGKGEIRYTLDGAQPDADSPVYSEPVVSEETFSLTAAAFLDGRRVGPVTSEVYLAVGDDLADFSSNLPVIIVESRGYRFSRDSSLSRDYPPQLVYSVIQEPGENGRANLTGAPSITGRAGMNVRGASSREWPKKSYKFETWDSTDGVQNVQLLGMPAENDWILHGPYFDKTFMRNHLAYLWWERLGYPSVRTRFIELFVNQDGDPVVELEDYVGVYLLMEKIKAGPDRVDIAELQPFHSEEPEITGGYLLQTTNIQQHFTTRRGTYMKYVSPRLDEVSSVQKRWIRDHLNDFERVLYGQEFDDPELGYAAWIDVPSHVDYDILRELTRNIDGASTFMSIDRGGQIAMGPLWDYNQSIGMTSLFGNEHGWETEGWNNAYMLQGGHWANWWDRLDGDLEYQTMWNDRWVELRAATLATELLAGDIDAAEALLDEAQKRNYERWNVLGKSVWITGSPREAPGYRDRDTYAKEVAWMRDWLLQRIAWIDTQVPAPPEFAPAGGALAAGTSVVIAPGTGFKQIEGKIYFTTDGADPRLRGGEPNPDATLYAQSIPVDGVVTISARTRGGDGEWSALGRTTFLAGAKTPHAGDLVISEIHYNPLESEDLEFIEITNVSDQLVDLSGVSVSEGVQFTFGIEALEAGASLVVVKDVETFQQLFASRLIRIAGPYSGRLANGGERLSLADADGGVLSSFAYDDSESWPAAADGGGHSLELVSLNADPMLAASWQASHIHGGTPGYVPLGYEAWAIHHFGTIKAPTEDSDGDYASNALEFAFATKPNSASDIPHVIPAISNGNLRLTFRRYAAASVTYMCQHSSDLASWESVTNCDTIATRQISPTEPAAEVGAVEEVTMHLPSNLEREHFFRLQVQVR